MANFPLPVYHPPALTDAQRYEVLMSAYFDVDVFGASTYVELQRIAIAVLRERRSNG